MESPVDTPRTQQRKEIRERRLEYFNKAGLAETSTESLNLKTSNTKPNVISDGFKNNAPAPVKYLPASDQWKSTRNQLAQDELSTIIDAQNVTMPSRYENDSVVTLELEDIGSQFTDITNTDVLLQDTLNLDHKTEVPENFVKSDHLHNRELSNTKKAINEPTQTQMLLESHVFTQMNNEDMDHNDDGESLVTELFEGAGTSVWSAGTSRKSARILQMFPEPTEEFSATDRRSNFADDMQSEKSSQNFKLEVQPTLMEQLFDDDYSNLQVKPLTENNLTKSDQLSEQVKPLTENNLTKSDQLSESTSEISTILHEEILPSTRESPAPRYTKSRYDLPWEGVKNGVNPLPSLSKTENFEHTHHNVLSPETKVAPMNLNYQSLTAVLGEEKLKRLLQNFDESEKYTDAVSEKTENNEHFNIWTSFDSSESSSIIRHPDNNRALFANKPDLRDHDKNKSKSPAYPRHVASTKNFPLQDSMEILPETIFTVPIKSDEASLIEELGLHTHRPANDGTDLNIYIQKPADKKAEVKSDSQKIRCSFSAEQIYAKAHSLAGSEIGVEQAQQNIYKVKNPNSDSQNSVDLSYSGKVRNSVNEHTITKLAQKSNSSISSSQKQQNPRQASSEDFSTLPVQRSPQNRTSGYTSLSIEKYFQSIENLNKDGTSSLSSETFEPIPEPEIECTPRDFGVKGSKAPISHKVDKVQSPSSLTPGRLNPTNSLINQHPSDSANAATYNSKFDQFEQNYYINGKVNVATTQPEMFGMLPIDHDKYNQKLPVKSNIDKHTSLSYLQMNGPSVQNQPIGKTIESSDDKKGALAPTTESSSFLKPTTSKASPRLGPHMASSEQRRTAQKHVTGKAKVPKRPPPPDPELNLNLRASDDSSTLTSVTSHGSVSVTSKTYKAKPKQVTKLKSKSIQSVDSSVSLVYSENFENPAASMPNPLKGELILDVRGSSDSSPPSSANTYTVKKGKKVSTVMDIRVIDDSSKSSGTLHEENEDVQSSGSSSGTVTDDRNGVSQQPGAGNLGYISSAQANEINMTQEGQSQSDTDPHPLNSQQHETRHQIPATSKIKYNHGKKQNSPQAAVSERQYRTNDVPEFVTRQSTNFNKRPSSAQSMGNKEVSFISQEMEEEVEAEYARVFAWQENLARTSLPNSTQKLHWASASPSITKSLNTHSITLEKKQARPSNPIQRPRSADTTKRPQSAHHKDCKLGHVPIIETGSHNKDKSAILKIQSMGKDIPKKSLLRKFWNSDYQRLVSLSPRVAAGDQSLLTCMPEELLLIIFKNLGPGDLVRTMQTCQQLKRVGEDKTLWSTVTIRKKVLLDEWMPVVASRQPKALNLVHCQGGELSEDVLRDLFRSCGNQLEELSLAYSSRGVLNGNTVIVHAMTRCPNLKSINVNGCNASDGALMALSEASQQICRLNLGGCQQLTDEGLIPIIDKHGLYLERLELAGCFNITARSVVNIANKCKGLTHLNLAQCWRLSEHCIVQIAHNLVELDTLDVRGCKQLNDRVVHEIVRNLPKLRILSIANCPNVTSNSLTEIATYCPDILSLDVYGCKGIGNEGIQSFVRGCLRIKYLDLSSTSVTGKGLTTLSNYCSHSLKTLRLNYCHNITLVNIEKLLRNCKGLRKLFIYGVRGLLDIEELRKVNPAVHVESDHVGQI